MTAPVSSLTRTVPISALRHSMVSPRSRFNTAKLERLANSLKSTHGPLEELIVRPHLESGQTVYEVVCGERRFRAALIAGLEMLPVEVRELSDAEAKRLALIDTLERERLSDLEHVEAVLDLLCFELGLDANGVQRVLNKMHHCQQKHRSLEPILEGFEAGADLAEQVEKVLKVFDEIGGTWRSFLTNALPLLELPEDILEGLRCDVLPSKTVALQLARVDCPAKRATLVASLGVERWSTRRLQDEIKSALGQTLSPASAVARRLREIATALEKAPELATTRQAEWQRTMTKLEGFLTR
jgi:ParB family transcriptional regulator, chromosome partitioning protein